jgi:hypothetical protein
MQKLPWAFKNENNLRHQRLDWGLNVDDKY